MARANDRPLKAKGWLPIIPDCRHHPYQAMLYTGRNHGIVQDLPRRGTIRLVRSVRVDCHSM